MFEEKKLIAEFEKQSFVQIIFPHAKTDWAPYLTEAQKSFENIIKTIAEFEDVLVICQNTTEVAKRFLGIKNIYCVSAESDDTWARDCLGLAVETNGKTELLDFTFNGWGNKFDATQDNRLTQSLKECYSAPVKRIDFVLEGGAVESNGKDTILTTTACMLNPNRNPAYNNTQITQKLKEFFGAQHILYLNHGYLAGDDTDSHIDTLARFIGKEHIMYVAPPSDKNDEHYSELLRMQEELQMIAKEKNLKLTALPFTDACYYEDERLPATYANFLFVNGGVIVPLYNVSQDAQALKIFKETFKNRKIVGVDASVLIRQHGSLHCITMQVPQSVKLTLL